MNFDVRWKGVAHKQIWDWVHVGGGAKSSSAAEKSLESMNKSLINAVDAVAKAVGRTEGVWKGDAATKATAGMQSLRQYTDGLRLTSFTSRNSTMGQAGTSDWARKNAPPVQNAGPKPVQPTGSPVGDVLKQTQDWQKREAEARNAERRAQEIMEQHTSYTRQRVDGMPALPVPKIVLNTEIAPPPAPPAPPGPAPVPPRVRGGGSGGGDGGEQGGGGQQVPAPRPDERVESGPGPTPTPTPVPEPNPIVPPDRSELVWNRDGSPGGGAGGSGASDGGGGYTGGSLGGGSGGLGGGGFVGGGVSGGVGGLGGGPGSGGGNPATPSPQAAPSKGTGGAARPAGTPGQQGFLQPASGAQQAEDSEHQRKYWIPGSDLFDDERLVAPPVIGED